MKQWPHAPVHLLHETGTFMVTAGTYKKQHFFNNPDRLDFLHESLLQTAEEFGWNLQAWALFSNHYHFVAISPEHPENLKNMISKLHANTARRLNKLENFPGAKVWFQYWDTRLTFQNSYFARLHYVHNNPFHHGVVNDPLKYRWCSAAWFARTADPAFFKTVASFKTDRVNVRDDFEI